MADDIAVRRLVEMLSAYFTEQKAVEEDLTCSLTSEFLRNMQDVLHSQQIFVYQRYHNFFKTNYEGMLISPDIFLRCVFYACLQDAFVNFNIFERFLSGFAIILRKSQDIRNRRGVIFCKLVPDIFMVFYEEELKKSFYKCGGFCRLVEYINNPNYLSKCIRRNISDPRNPDSDINKMVDQLETWIVSQKPDLPNFFGFEESDNGKKSYSLAQRVLKTAKSQIIRLPSDDVSKANLLGLNRQKIAQNEEKRTILTSVEGDSELTFDGSSNFDETNDGTVGQMLDNAWHEKIIEAVIKHNHSKSSSHGRSKGRIQTEAEEILKNLQINIKSLMDVLDEGVF